MFFFIVDFIVGLMLVLLLVLSLVLSLVLLLVLLLALSLVLSFVLSKKKKFIILVIGPWRSRASSMNVTIMTSRPIFCNRSFMALEQINIYTILL